MKETTTEPQGEGWLIGDAAFGLFLLSVASVLLGFLGAITTTSYRWLLHALS